MRAAFTSVARRLKYRVVALLFVLSNLLLWQLIQHRAAVYAEARCHFGYQLPNLLTSLVPERWTALIFAILAAAVVLSFDGGVFLVLFPLCAITVFCLGALRPETIFRECYGMGGPSEDVSGLGFIALALIATGIWSSIVLAFSALWWAGEAYGSRKR